MADNLKPARRRKIVGDLGATVSQVERKIYRVVDVRAVPDLILNSKTVHEAIVAVAKSMSKHMPSIAGIEITTENDKDRKSVGSGQSVSDRVELGGRRITKKN